MQTKELKDIINFPVMLAPMVGLSHAALRKSLRSYLSNDTRTLWSTEMLSSRRLHSEGFGNNPECLKYEDEDLLYPQLLGNEEKFIRKSIELLESWGAKAIDINMGCPVQKALRHNYGVSLMGDKEYAGKVVNYATSSTNLPVSVKLRAGEQKDEKYLLSFCEELIGNGASWLTLHPRLAGEKRKGTADWSQIKLLKQSFDIPIIGNGDIQCIEDIDKMFQETSCDAVMIGRALTAKPWLLLYIENQTRNTNNTLPKDDQQKAEFYGEYLKLFVDNCFTYFDDKAAIKRIRFFVNVGHVWLNFGHSLSKGLMKTRTQTEIKNFIKIFFKNSSLRICDRTNLRY